MIIGISFMPLFKHDNWTVNCFFSVPPVAICTFPYFRYPRIIPWKIMIHWDRVSINKCITINIRNTNTIFNFRYLQITNIPHSLFSLLFPTRRQFSWSIWDSLITEIGEILETTTWPTTLLDHELWWVLTTFEHRCIIDNIHEDNSIFHLLMFPPHYFNINNTY